VAETGSSPTGTLEDILKRARKRYLANLLIRQAAIAVCAGAGGIMLLLLTGTQILDWYWPLALFAIVLAYGVYRVSRLNLPTYRLAQMIDRSLDLQDRLSTAFYFRRLAPPTQSRLEPSIALVEAQATTRIHPADIDHALPLTFPRTGYAACAFIVAAIAMLGLRYGILRTLNLEKPLARISFDTFGATPKVEAASAKKSVIQEHLEKQLQQLGMTLDEMPTPPEAPPLAPQTVNVPAVADESGGNVQGTPGKSPTSNPEGSEEGGKSDDQSGDKSSGESKDEGAGQQGQQKGQQSAAAPKTPPKNPGNNPGVMDKMKDALANLLNKLGSNPQQKSETASNQEQQQGGKQQMNQKGTQGQGKSQGDSQQSPDPEGGQDAEAGDKTPGQQQNASQQAADKPGSENSKSGMGKSDGDKSIKDAEQLAAMGKISEIFGKRAAEMQGEMSVEVPSGKQQQLKTAYSKNSATHAGAVADSNRNEIPLMYQTYVQRYFEEVRKTAAPAKPNKPVTP
jgi:hypothetical protein